MAARAVSRGVGRRAKAPAGPALGLAVALVALLAAAGQSAGSATIDALPTTYTGVSFLATANVSDPSSVVLYEWDFDGDGRIDVNRTSDPAAAFVFTIAKPDYSIQLNVTRIVGGNMTHETASVPVRVDDGTPTVAIDLPDRLVSGVDLTFTARAQDPDSQRGGELFAYRWTVDGAAVSGGGSSVQIAVPTTGPHQISVEVTDAEGQTASATVTADYASAGLFEGRGGAVNLGLLTAAGALALGLPLVALQRREARAASHRKSKGPGSSPATPATGSVGERGSPPGKMPLAASSEGAQRSGPRIALGGTPASLQRTRECVVCHNTVDADLKDCPYCAGNDRAAAFEKTLEAEPYSDLDLSEVKAVLQRARRQRHLGLHSEDAQLIRDAQNKADGLAADAREARMWIPKAEWAMDSARSAPDGGGETAERAEAYLKLAHSLAKAQQFGKAARHAKRVVEFLAKEESGGRAPEPAPTQGEDADAESRVRADIAALREDVKRGDLPLDALAFELLKAAEDFERSAQWPQALEVLATLREKLDRARDAAAGPSTDGEKGGDPPPPG